jgi:hypothetical protein
LIAALEIVSPRLPLALDQDQAVVISLETTYHEAARRVYLD